MNSIKHRINQSLEIDFDEAIKIHELALRLSYLPQEVATDHIRDIMHYKALWEQKLIYYPTDTNNVYGIMRFYNNRISFNKKAPSRVQEIIDGCFIRLDLPSMGYFIYRYALGTSILDLLYADVVGFTSFIQSVDMAIQVNDNFVAILYK